MNCPYFNKCACTNNESYEKQLKKKQEFLESKLKTEIKVFSDNPLNYRNRMDFYYNKGLTLKKQGDWTKEVHIKECMISNPKLNELMKEINNFFTEDIPSLKYVVIRTPGESSITFIISDETPLNKIKEFSKISKTNHILIGRTKDDKSTTENLEILKGSRFLTTKLCNKTFKYSTQGFFQNNNVMAEKMLNYTNELLKKYPTKGTLLDLYGGVGTFGIINAKLFDKTHILEVDQGSIEAAKENIKLNNVNAEATLINAKNLRKLDFEKPLYVITDPPRAGMNANTIKQLNLLEPEVIIYISCNPSQLVREMPYFRNYKLKSAALFDLFPQTEHMETVVELVKIK